MYAFLIDFLGSNLLGFVLGIAYGMVLTLRGMPLDEVQAHMAALTWHSPFMLLTILLGTSISVLAGFLCARSAKRHEYRCAVIAVTLSSGLMTWLIWDQFSMAVSLGLLLLSYAAFLTGARWGCLANRKALAIAG
ncbi:hypothetical protein [Chitinolyticbacter meiyuanensis]|uniref:hypothetical protein n=1 Tax=Chitinolyticbacter meiyuanensis TaxID=682798 RepID=UPI0011E5D3A0|nr:hypothetical protein [Chitinolyticbacter meiyuanensis]